MFIYIYIYIYMLELSDVTGPGTPIHAKL